MFPSRDPSNHVGVIIRYLRPKKWLTEYISHGVLKEWNRPPLILQRVKTHSRRSTDRMLKVFKKKRKTNKKHTETVSNAIRRCLTVRRFLRSFENTSKYLKKQTYRKSRDHKLRVKQEGFTLSFQGVGIQYQTFTGLQSLGTVNIVSRTNKRRESLISGHDGK